MKKREEIKKGIFLYFCEVTREQAIKEDGTSEEDAASMIIYLKKPLEEAAERLLEDYDNYLLNKLLDEFANKIKEYSISDKISLTSSIKDIKDFFDKKHTKVENNLSKISTFQKKTRKKIVEEQIEEIINEKELLVKHVEALNKIIEVEAHKTSWLFVIISFIILMFWSSIIYYKGWNDMEKWTFIVMAFLGFCNFFYYALYNKYFTPEELKAKKAEEIQKHTYSLYKYETNMINKLNALYEIKSKELNKLNDDLE